MKNAIQIAELLKAACKAHPEGQKGWAAEHGFSAVFVGDICRRKRDASERIAGALGFERAVVYLSKKAN